jgi:catabolite regulation protein CreA
VPPWWAVVGDVAPLQTGVAEFKMATKRKKKEKFEHRNGIFWKSVKRKRYYERVEHSTNITIRITKSCFYLKKNKGIT